MVFSITFLRLMASSKEQKIKPTNISFVYIQHPMNYVLIILAKLF